MLTLPDETWYIAPQCCRSLGAAVAPHHVATGQGGLGVEEGEETVAVIVIREFWIECIA